MNRRTYHWFAVAAPGLESVVASEVRRLPDVAEVIQTRGGVDFTGPLATGYLANLTLRIATRIVVRVGEVTARDFARLRDGLATLSWPDFVRPGARIRVEATARHCRLIHTGALAERLLDAIAQRLAAKVMPDRSEDAQRILIRGEDDRFVISVDASGALLHRRGWRLEAGEAPLRETLAAGALALAGWAPGEALCDPMCGSGTFIIEAALQQVPSLLTRPFAMESWPCFGDAGDVVATAIPHNPDVRSDATPRDVAPLVGSDRDAQVIERAQRNAERAGVFDHVRFDVLALERATAPAPRGLLITNPPYGRRLETRGGARDAMEALWRALVGPFRSWRAAILVGNRAHLRRVERRIRNTYALRNGGTPVWLACLDPVEPTPD